MANNKQKTVIINSAQNKKTIKMLKMGGIIFGALIVIICFCYFLLGNVRISFAETKFSMTGLFVSETWNYEDVYEAYLTDDFDTGMMSFGTDTKDTINGIYNNNELGEYTIAAYRDINTYIVMRNIDGSRIAFNLKTLDLTNEAWDEMQKHLTQEQIGKRDEG